MMTTLHTKQFTENPACELIRHPNHILLKFLPEQSGVFRLIHDLETSLPLSVEVGGRGSIELIEYQPHHRKHRTLIRSIRIDEDAVLRHQIVRFEASQQMDHHLDVMVHRNGFYHANYIDVSYSSTSSKVTIDLQGRGSSVTWNSAVISSKTMKKRLEIHIANLKPDTTSTLYQYGAVLDGGGLSFLGNQAISKGAIHSKAQQKNNIMVFDTESIATTKPMLQIDENEVEASHSSAVGAIDESLIFYLCSRGLSEAEAKRSIAMGCFKPVFSEISNQTLQRKVQTDIERQVMSHV